MKYDRTSVKKTLKSMEEAGREGQFEKRVVVITNSDDADHDVQNGEAKWIYTPRCHSMQSRFRQAFKPLSKNCLETYIRKLLCRRKKDVDSKNGMDVSFLLSC